MRVLHFPLQPVPERDPEPIEDVASSAQELMVPYLQALTEPVDAPVWAYLTPLLASPSVFHRLEESGFALCFPSHEHQARALRWFALARSALRDTLVETLSRRGWRPVGIPTLQEVLPPKTIAADAVEDCLLPSPSFVEQCKARLKNDGPDALPLTFWAASQGAYPGSLTYSLLQAAPRDPEAAVSALQRLGARADIEGLVTGGLYVGAPESRVAALAAVPGLVEQGRLSREEITPHLLEVLRGGGAAGESAAEMLGLVGDRARRGELIRTLCGVLPGSEALEHNVVMALVNLHLEDGTQLPLSEETKLAVQGIVDRGREGSKLAAWLLSWSDAPGESQR